MVSTFVIGDVHGRLDRLIALLTKAKVRPNDQIVQLGDLGDYREHTRSEDETIWNFAATLPNMAVLMGNHEAAVYSPAHRFRGYADPLPGTVRAIRAKGLTFAMERNGYLLTHAGMHPAWGSYVGSNAGQLRIIASRLNQWCSMTWDQWIPVRDNISPMRGGKNLIGGLLWRAHNEDLAEIPQVYGHTSDFDIRTRGSSVCIDVASKHDNNLAGIWLPSMKVVAVGDDAAFLERAMGEQ